MNLEEIKKFLEENKDKPEVKAFVDGFVTADAVSGYLETKDGKKLLQPILDKNFNKGLETWKEKTLPGLIEEEVQKRNPQKTEDQKRIEKLEQQLEQEKKDRQREVLMNKALEIATEKKLPTKLIARFLGDDEESTLANLGEFEEVLSSHVKEQVEATFKEHGRHIDPGQDLNRGDGIDIASLAAEASIRK